MTTQIVDQAVAERNCPPNARLADEPHGSLFKHAAEYLTVHWVRFLAVSAIVLVPCFWHRRIEAGDLASHVYNAWLAHLVSYRQVTGLWIASQHTNILFDWLLSGSTSVFGYAAGEKIAVAACVLIFFWGAFALACAASECVQWYPIPYLAVLSYGWTFEIGFFNYYLALGLSSFALAVFWRGKKLERAISLALLPLIWLAHPLGALWLVGAAALIQSAKIGSRVIGILSPLVAACSLVALREYLWRHYIAYGVNGLSFYNGQDQFILYGARYYIPELAILFFCIICILADVRSRWRTTGLWRSYGILLELYVLTIVGVLLLPDKIVSSDYSIPLYYLIPRLTCVSAILTFCMLAVMLPRKWHLVGFAAIAVVFFSFLYQDTGVLNQAEWKAEQMLHTLPAWQRVLVTIPPTRTSRILVHHIVDRACIGWCFSYGNYEPSSRAFRVRALPNNLVVMADSKAADQAAVGTYVVQPGDLPVFEIYECGPLVTDLCLRKLQAKQPNGSIAGSK